MLAMIVCLLVLTVTADLMTDRIPNALTLTGLVAGLWHGYERAGPSGLLSAAAAAGGMFLIGFFLFRLRALRGGDGKLMAVLSAVLGFRQGGRILLLSLLIAVLMGIPLMMRERIGKDRSGRMLLLRPEKTGTGIHFSVPVLLSTLLILGMI